MRAAFMSVRPIVLAVLTTGLTVVSGPVMAQFLPPTFSYPSGGYRGVPDQDGVMTIDPDDDVDTRRRPGRTPNARAPYQQGAPYPYDPRSERDSASGYDPRIPAQPDSRRQPAEPYAAAPSGAYQAPNYGTPRGPYGHIGDRAPDAPTSLQPGAVQSSPLPPAIVPFPGAQPPAAATAPAAPRPNTVAALPPEDQPEVGEPKELPPQFKRQVVPFVTKEPAGTIIVDTPSTYLYYVLGDGTAVRYGIGVGREGFTWSGTEKITKLAEWPDWHPPAEMIERQPYLPRFMAGGPGNPLGARALYLGRTIYRIHGTNQPSTIGQFVSSGCIRMLNEDVEDLYSRVKVGTRVVVRPGGPPPSISSSAVPVTR